MDTGELDEFRAMIDAAERVVIFTGAGMSTESGIPDYRSPGTGLWTKTKPVQFQEFMASDEARQRSWQNRFDSDRVMESAAPNKGHEAVAKLVREDKAIAVITQNIDNLHHVSGIPADKIVELHGNTTYAKCLSCELRYEMADLETQYRTTGRVAPCGSCGGIVKAATISFGQAMPEREMLRSQQFTEACDLMIVIGSSLVVYPAAGFPEYAKRLGAKLVILNRDETPLDPIADLVLHREIGETLSYVVGIN